MKSPNFYGCLFTSAAAEFPDASSPIHIVCSEHKRSLLSYIQMTVESAGFEDAEALALRLLILLDGAVTHAYITGNQHALQEAKTLAEYILRSEGTRKDAA